MIYDGTNFVKVMQEHRHFVNKDCKNWEGMYAKFINFKRLTVSFQKFSCRGILMVRCNLSEVDLKNINFSGATFKDCDLGLLDFTGSNLSEVEFDNCRFYKTNFSNCNMENAKFVNCTGARTLVWNEKTKHLNSECPKDEVFIGWKKAQDKDGKPVILKLHIYCRSRRCSAFGKECRCNSAKVLEYQRMDGTVLKKMKCAYSYYDSHFIYPKNKKIYSDGYDGDWTVMDTTGIHFYMNRKDAVEWNPETIQYN